APTVAPSDRRGVVGRAVVDDDDLRLLALRQDAVDRLGEVVRLLVARDDDADAWHAEGALLTRLYLAARRAQWPGTRSRRVRPGSRGPPGISCARRGRVEAARILVQPFQEDLVADPSHSPRRGRARIAGPSGCGVCGGRAGRRR